MHITACAVATSSCISDVPSQWEGRNFDPHSSHIFQPILMKLETKIERCPGYDPTCKIWLMWDDGKGVCVGRAFPVTFCVPSFFLYSCSRLQVTPEDRSLPFMAQNACFRVRYALLGVSIIKNNVWGSKLPKNMILGGLIGILSQICEIFESRYLEKYALDQHEILRGILGAQMDFVGGPALQNYNSRWRQPPSWIFAQTSITQPRIDVDE